MLLLLSSAFGVNACFLCVGQLKYHEFCGLCGCRDVGVNGGFVVVDVEVDEFVDFLPLRERGDTVLFLCNL